MHRCDDVINLLTEYMDGDLPPDRVRLLEAELAICEPCTLFLQTLRRTRDAASSLRCQDLPPECHSRLRALLDARIIGRAPRGARRRTTTPRRG